MANSGSISIRLKPLFIAWLILAVLIAFSPCEGADDWARALGLRNWTFPKDHGAHPEYRTEWWYFTGNLQDDAGSRYGYQLTFFRQGVRRSIPLPANSWDIGDVYAAHFALTDVAQEKFRWAERISRSGPGLAGAGTEGMHVWLLNWFGKMRGDFISLRAQNKGMDVELELSPQKPLVFHGQNGLSRKGPEAGQASYYYSFTSLETKGFLKTDSAKSRVAVRGQSWFDHEFGSNQLSANQQGWDWFSLHLSDGRDLMIYLLRLKDGSFEPESSGTLVDSNGKTRHLKLQDLVVSVLERWKSPLSKGDYPSRWRIQIPLAGIDLTVAPLVSDQELNTKESTGIIYWEGAVAGGGTSNGYKISCEGYVELTGYAGSLAGRF